MNYSDKLKDPRWQKKRLLIMQRDDWKCRKCSDKGTTLNVHHIAYIKGREPWDYEDSNFITLCRNCHEREHEPTVFNIYLAGKIAKTDWRHEIVPGLRNCESTALDKGVFGEHNYVGPFFISCDHGCGHDRTENSSECGHGRSLTNCTESQEAPAPGRDRAFIDCQSNVQNCDLFFAWIEDLTCFGTLVEIGMAHSWGKKIYLGCPNKLPDDLWFSAKASCSYVIENSVSASDALRAAIVHAKTCLVVKASR